MACAGARRSWFRSGTILACAAAAGRCQARLSGSDLGLDLRSGADALQRRARRARHRRDARVSGDALRTADRRRRVQAPGPVAPAALEAGRRPERRGDPARCRGTRHVPRALRSRGDGRRDDLRPARYPLRAATRARHEGGQGRQPQGRPQLRARHDRDPHPRADPGQVRRRRRGPEPEPFDRDARRHLRRPARDREPAQRLARQGHLGLGRLGRPRADAAHPDRGHDGRRQVRLHQHDPDVDPAARDTRRGAVDPDRPETNRAQLLRVDPAPPDAGRLEPEGSLRRPPQLRDGDGAPLRAPQPDARPQPARGESRASASAGRRSCPTCSS